MAKRFSDTDKWKKPFIRGLQGAYKLLWFYILDDCDHAGIWHVDFEVAQIRIGEKIDQKQAELFFTEKIQIINGGSKWFIRDFIEFQYGELKENNRLHVSVLNILDKNGLGACKPLTRGQGQEQGIIQGNGQGQIQSQEEIKKAIFSDELWMESVSRTHQGKNLEQAFNECYLHHSNNPNPPKMLWEWRQKFNTWLSIKQLPNGHQKERKKLL